MTPHTRISYAIKYWLVSSSDHIEFAYSYRAACDTISNLLAIGYSIAVDRYVDNNYDRAMPLTHFI